MRFLAFIAAIVLFVLAAIFAFFVDEPDVELRTIIGIVAAGLACFVIALTPGPPANWRT